MSLGNSRLAMVSKFRKKSAPVKFFRISQLRRLCECEKVAAVCYRVNDDGTQFLLVQTRRGRWTFPKGSVEPGLTHAQSAALEAYEEAGVHGRMEEVSFTRYFRRDGTRRESRQREIAVHAHLCEVSRLEAPLERYRNPTWFSPEETKRHLRKGRASEEGAETARVVGRAMARIERLRTVASLPQLRMATALDLEGSRTALQRKDALRKVEFTIIEHPSREVGSNAGVDPSRRRIAARSSAPLLRERDS